MGRRRRSQVPKRSRRYTPPRGLDGLLELPGVRLNGQRVYVLDVVVCTDPECSECGR